ncbi:MAG: Thiamin transporter substrate binding subunit [uncultured bacterium]|nr:MAG: Thiamin transporter substrate binding subunit [uncultured bacterium]
MQRIIKSSLIAAVLLTLIGCSTSTNSNQATTNSTPTKPTTLTVYTYESLTADYGLLPLITKQFETDHNIKIELVSFPDTGAMLNQLIAEKSAPKADVVLGLDNINFVDATTYDLLQPYKPARATELAPDLWFDDAYTMTPFDYGYVGFVYDTKQIQFDEPISLATLATDPAYQDKIILEQPGLSSPGTQFLVWLQAAFADNATDTVNNFSNQVLTVAPDWNTAYYTMFLNGEAPIVLSYLTSPAYHIDQEQSTQYAAIPISEGYLRQVEGVAVVKGSAAQTTAQAFIDYLLTDDVQNQIPRTQWMWPVLGDKNTWPAAFNQIITPTAEQILTVPPATLKTNYPTWLTEWNTAFGTL